MGALHSRWVSMPRNTTVAANDITRDTFGIDGFFNVSRKAQIRIGMEMIRILKRLMLALMQRRRTTDANFVT